MRKLWITISLLVAASALGSLGLASCGNDVPGQNQALPPANVVASPMPTGDLGTVVSSGVDVKAARPPPPDFNR